MSNTKYQAVATDEEPEQYTQAPPSYQGASSAEPTYGAVPRSEDDNLPDDFKVIPHTGLICRFTAALTSGPVWWLCGGGDSGRAYGLHQEGLRHLVSHFP